MPGAEHLLDIPDSWGLVGSAKFSICTAHGLYLHGHSSAMNFLYRFIVAPVERPGCLRAAPQLFISLGTGQRAALLATIVTGVVNHFATYVSLWAADSFGRRFLFLEGGVQMAIALVHPLMPRIHLDVQQTHAPAWEAMAVVAGNLIRSMQSSCLQGLPWT